MKSPVARPWNPSSEHVAYQNTLELEGFGVDAGDTREMWRECIEHIVECWANEYTEFEGKYWSMPRRRVQPKPIQNPHPPIFGATASHSGHQMMGELGIGLCSFGVASSPEDVARRMEIYRKAAAACTKPIGRTVNNSTASFTMVNCAPTAAESRAIAEESYLWYVKNSVTLDRERGHLDERARPGTRHLRLAEGDQPDDRGQACRPAQLRPSRRFEGGSPGDTRPTDRNVETARPYEEAGVDLLLCLVNPYEIPHEKVMQTIELMGKHVIPEFDP